MDLPRTKDHSVPRLHFYTPTPVQVADQRVLELQSVLDKYKNQLSRVQGDTSTAVSTPTPTRTYTPSSVPVLTKDPKGTILFLILLGDTKARELLNKILKRGNITDEDKNDIAEVSEKIVEKLLETQEALKASQVGLINRFLNTFGIPTASSEEAIITDNLGIQSNAMNGELTKVFIGFITDAIEDLQDKAYMEKQAELVSKKMETEKADKQEKLRVATVNKLDGSQLTVEQEDGADT